MRGRIISDYRGLCLLLLAVTYFGGIPSAAQYRETKLAIAHPGTSAGPEKFEGGLQISWRDSGGPGDPNQSDTDPSATVEIFDATAHRIGVVRVAPALIAADPSYTAVSIWDVSARKPGFIAIAAVYTRANLSNLPVLLYFNWDGTLHRRTVLDNSQEIRSLEIDREGHVWTLNDFDAEDPGDYVFSEFDGSASLVKTLLKPEADWSTNESSSTGEVSFGLTDGTVWAWLPEPRTLVAADVESGRAVIYNPGLPSVPQGSAIQPRKAALLPNGQLLLDIAWRPDGTKFDAAWFIWSSHAGWKKIRTPATGHFDTFYGVNGDQAIFSSDLPGWSTDFFAAKINDVVPGDEAH